MPFCCVHRLQLPCACVFICGCTLRYVSASALAPSLRLFRPLQVPLPDMDPEYTRANWVIIIVQLSRLHGMHMRLYAHLRVSEMCIQTHRVALSLSLSRARALSLAPAPALAHVLLCLRLGAERRCYTVMRGAELKVMLSLALALALAPSRARSLSRAWQDFSRTSALSLMSMRHA